MFPDTAVWLLAGVRIAGMIAFAPGLSARMIPARTRVCLALGIGAVMGASIAGSSGLQITTIEAYIIAILAELGVGITIGFGMSLLFEAIRFAGQALDVHIGFAQATQLDPASGVQTAIVARMYYFTAIVLFIQLNGHHWLLAGLQRSFDLIPLAGLTFGPGLTELFVDLVGSIFSVGLRLAAPVMAAVFLTDLAFGFMARVVPQMNVLLVGIPAKMLTGLAVLAVSAPLLVYTVSRLITDLKESLYQVLQVM